jgi:hypothetical protein
VRRKTAKRTLPWDLKERELDLVLPPQDEDIPARKKPRLEEHLPTTTDEDTRKTASPDVSVGLPPPTADNDDENAGPVTDTQRNADATPATGSWTLEEDAKLTSVLASTSKKKWGKVAKPDGLQFPRWFQVEREISAGVDGSMSWIPASAKRVDARVNGQKTKTAS